MKPGPLARHFLATLLCEPHLAAQLNVRDWERLVWQARSAELLGQLHRVLKAANVLVIAPEAAQQHLEVAANIASKHVDAVRWELRNIREALGPVDGPVLLLKGAAYCASGAQASIGRMFNDIDILVPKPTLGLVEGNFIRAGWLPSHVNKYDDRYYREWMHELPPMEHKNRSTVLDVHHTIVAPTSGIRPDPSNFFEASLPLSGEWAFFRVLAPEDMVIHSASHLFLDEFHKGLRDLFDLHSLMSEFSVDPMFWEKLIARSEFLGLAVPVCDALRQSVRLFKTKVPSDVLQNFERRHCAALNQRARLWLFDQVLRPHHSSASNALTQFARWIAFARSHWLRMPVPLLAYHLSHKLLRRDD